MPASVRETRQGTPRICGTNRWPRPRCLSRVFYLRFDGNGKTTQTPCWFIIENRFEPSGSHAFPISMNTCSSTGKLIFGLSEQTHHRNSIKVTRSSMRGKRTGVSVSEGIPDARTSTTLVRCTFVLTNTAHRLYIYINWNDLHIHK